MKELNIAKCGVIIGSALGMKVFQDGIETLRVIYKRCYSLGHKPHRYGSSVFNPLITAITLYPKVPVYWSNRVDGVSSLCFGPKVNYFVATSWDKQVSTHFFERCFYLFYVFA